MQQNFFTALDVDLTTNQQVVFQRWNTLVAFAHFQWENAFFGARFLSFHLLKDKFNISQSTKPKFLCREMGPLQTELSRHHEPAEKTHITCSVGEEDTFPSVIRLFQLHWNLDNGRNLIGRQNRNLSVLDSAVHVNIVSERIFCLLGSFAFGSQGSWNQRSELIVASESIVRVNTNTHTHTRTYMYTHSSAGVINTPVTSWLKPHRRGDDKVAIITNTITYSSSYICHWLTGEELKEKKVNSCFYEARRAHKRVLRVWTALCRWLRKWHGLVAESEEQSRPWNLFFL